MQPWSGTLTLFPGAVLFQGLGGDAAWHAHHAVQLMSAEREPLILATRPPAGEPGGGVPHRRETRAALILSGIPHEVRCAPQPLLLLLVEPFGPRGRALRDAASATPAHLHAAEHALAGASSAGAEPAELAEAMLAAVVPGLVQAPTPSSEVRAALRHIERAAPHGEVRLARAAADASLSPSRLTHRFSAETGIPFRRYVLWVRIRLAVETIAGGARGISEAAAAGGFSDGAHLSRVFKRNFGLPPSALLGMRVSEGSWAERAPRDAAAGSTGTGTGADTGATE